MAASAAASREAVAVTIALEEEVPIPVKQRKWRWPSPPAAAAPGRVLGEDDRRRRVVHAAKVGVALVLVSLLYILEVVHDRLGDNSMWAVMTVVVIFELTSGGTISKGINRGLGTVTGGGLGFLVAYAAQEIGGRGRAVVIGISLFIFGAAATYTRLLPRIKRRYDYGALIFILTFSLVSVSGIRGDQILEIASDRVTAICMGFAVCICVGLLVSPFWAGDDLHEALVSKLNRLALSFEEFAECLRSSADGKGDSRAKSISGKCLSVLNSKSEDESLANFARWEPWHGRFGLSHPWEKYLRIGDLLRELAAATLSLEPCLQSKHQPSAALFSKVIVKEQCEAACSILGAILREMGEHLRQMRRPHTAPDQAISFKIGSLRTALSSPALSHEVRIMLAGSQQAGEAAAAGELSAASFVFNLTRALDRVEEVAKEVDELGVLARFRH